MTVGVGMQWNKIGKVTAFIKLKFYRFTIGTERSPPIITKGKML